MNVRLGTKDDLSQLKLIFDKIIKNMEDNNINIWNEYYPFDEFESDIKNEGLFVIEDNGTIVASFSLFNSMQGAGNFSWTSNTAKVLYLGRVGVNVSYLRQGIGSLVVKYAKDIAIKRGAKYLRLSVVDINLPAINLYLKNGFKKVEGVYKDYSECSQQVLTELGFELKI